MPSTITPTLSKAIYRSLPTFGFFSLHAILDAPCAWLLIMTCASAVLSHVISRLSSF